MRLSLFPPDLSNLWLCIICVYVGFGIFMCVYVIIGRVQTHDRRSSSLKAMKSINGKPQMFGQIHNNADHKYWEEETPKNSLHSWSLFSSIRKSCSGHSGFSATKTNLRVTWSITITIKHFTAYQCCMTLSSASCQPLDTCRMKQKLCRKWSL